jgi:CelD/BcsL family acetyltransferase involved in cellulose biosynthesis
LGIFQLFFAKLEGRRIAAHACFDIGNRREYFFSGRTPELEELRAGKLLVMHTVQDAIAKGFKYYDFGYGGDEYKSEFTRTHRLARSLFLAKDESLLDLEKLFPKYEYMVLESA